MFLLYRAIFHFFVVNVKGHGVSRTRCLGRHFAFLRCMRLNSCDSLSYFLFTKMSKYTEMLADKCSTCLTYEKTMLVCFVEIALFCRRNILYFVDVDVAE